MDLETIRKKSVADLREIAAMLGIEVPDKCTKAKLIELIAGDGGNGNDAPAENEKLPGTGPEAGRTQNASKRGRPKGSTNKKAAAPKPEKSVKAAEPAEPASPEKAAEPAKPSATEKAAASARPAEHREDADKEKGKNSPRSGKRGRPPKARQGNPAEAAAAPQEERGSTTEKAPEKAPAKAPDKAPERAAGKSAEKPAEKPAEETNGNGRKLEFSENSEEVSGLLDVMPEGYGFLRTNKYYTGSKDVFVAPNFIRKYGLRTGDELTGRSRPQRDNDKYQALFYITSINERPPEQATSRVAFESLTPIYPDEQLKLETVQNELSTRLIDLIAPIGKGQRGMIVSPPKAGKTVLLKKIANAITANYPKVKLIVLLIDERPEEVTDMRESIQGEVVSSTFDEMPERHIKVAEMVFERARRLVEFGHDVVILMDSLTRLARAYNITITPTGRSLSGGLDPGAMYSPKKFFGAARNIRGGGSLTIVATALIDTGSKMDDVIFEEFKGTGNMELHLDRKLSEKRVFPAIDINKSGTRKEELLLSEAAMNAVYSIRKAIAAAGGADVTEAIVSKMLKTQDNEEFIKLVKVGIDRPGN